jgi:hypothetical protein
VTVVYGVGEPEGEYRLACPTCTATVRGLLRPDTVMELATSGARLLDPVGPLTISEIEDFVVSLDEPGALEQELAQLAR